jgi:RNA polymerase sigma-70 factor (ECF subfamily)
MYEANFALVWRALGRLGVPESDLKDATQKVFLTAFLKLSEFEGRSLLSTWLWGICRHVALAQRRSAARKREVVTDPANFDALAERHVQQPNPSERDSPEQIAIDNVLAKMSEAHRVVFLLFEVDEMEGADIAALLDIPLGTVRSRVRYARELFAREVRRLDAVNTFAKHARAR